MKERMEGRGACVEQLLLSSEEEEEEEAWRTTVSSRLSAASRSHQQNVIIAFVPSNRPNLQTPAEVPRIIRHVFTVTKLKQPQPDGG